MKSILKVALGAAAVLFVCGPAVAQTNTKVIAIYRAAPGHLEQLLEWLAKQDEAGRAAGVAAAQLFVHQDGASWDLLQILPATTPEQDRAVDAAAAKMGMATGPRRGLELRQHIAEHTDTFVAGPTTAAEWLSRVRRP